MIKTIQFHLDLHQGDARRRSAAIVIQVNIVDVETVRALVLGRRPWRQLRGCIMSAFRKCFDQVYNLGNFTDWADAAGSIVARVAAPAAARTAAVISPA